MPEPVTNVENRSLRLVPVLGLFSATAIVVGEMIGSGIFFMPQQVASEVQPYVGLILALWLVCGLVNLCGALTLAELAAMLPQEGGTYVFLREAYGRTWSFLWCWAEFWVMRTGAIALLATFAAINAVKILEFTGWTRANPAQPGLQKGIAIGLIVLLAGCNMAGTRWGSGVQNVMTSLKVAFVLLLAALPVMVFGSEPIQQETLWPEAIDRSLLSRLGTALAAIMWAYDGWGNVTVVAEEVRRPEKTLPRALILGVCLVAVLYFGANLAIHATLPVEEIAKPDTVPAATVVKRLFPGFGEPLMLTMLMISLAGALNGNILVGPRVLFAVARDHHFLSFFTRLSARRHVPARATGAMCGWAILLILLADLTRGQHEPLSYVLINYCMFGGSIFYFSAVLAVFVLRARRPNASRPYRTWGYPWVPAVFLAFYLFLLGSLFYARQRESLIGLAFIGVGWVVYLLAERPPRPKSV